MVERTPQKKGVLRVFGYDPEAPDEAPAPIVQPVWSQQDIEDFTKAMGGPWFIPPCFSHEYLLKAITRSTVALQEEQRDGKRKAWAAAINAAFAGATK